MTVDVAAPAADAVSYDDLYRRWERGNWSATAIDFAADREQWSQSFGELERRAALWNYALFLHGEDSVADNLSPYIDAAPREEQKYFLATQQADEARHAVFFQRFMHEVAGAGDSMARTLAETEPELTWGFRKVFERLDQTAAELRRDRSRPRLAAAVTLYHVVIEAGLAQPGQHFIQSYLERRELLPGFRSGMDNVSLDEQRHIGFGVKLLADLVRENPECRDAIAQELREVAPFSLAVFVPPGWDTRYVECFGFTLEQIYAEGARSLEARLRAAGLPLDELRTGMSPELSPLERAEHGLRLLRAGYFGEKTGPPSRKHEDVETLFASVRNVVDMRYAPPRPAAIQWDFSDAEPWFLALDGSAHVHQGRHPDPDLTLSCSLETFVDITAGRTDPRRALVLRRLRPRGSLRMLARMNRLLGT